MPENITYYAGTIEQLNLGIPRSHLGQNPPLALGVLAPCGGVWGAVHVGDQFTQLGDREAG